MEWVVFGIVVCNLVLIATFIFVKIEPEIHERYSPNYDDVFRQITMPDIRSTKSKIDWKKEGF